MSHRLLLRTLGRGDGLLGMRPGGPFGPRAAQVTIAWVHSPDSTDDALAEAHQCLAQMGLHPVARRQLQWRAPSAATAAGLPDAPLWSLVQEDQFGDFWAEQLPRLQQQGWQIVVAPGFAHESVPVQAWRLVLIDGGGGPVAADGRCAPVPGGLQALAAAGSERLGRAVAAPMQGRPQKITALRQPHGQGSWMLSLGVEVEGQVLDLVPMLAPLIQAERRWRVALELAHIDDAEIIDLRAPGGRRIRAPAAPLKAIVGAMLDLLTDPRRQDGPFKFQGWDAQRLESLRLALGTDQAQRAGPHGAWALQGEAGLRALAARLRGAAGAAPMAAPHDASQALETPSPASLPPPLAAPPGLGVTLRPYQLKGVAWLQQLHQHHLAGILADDMGLGKTAQTLAHLLIEMQAGRLQEAPALVVVPASLLFNWQAEAARMAPALRVLTLAGPRRATEHARIDGQHLVLTSYPLLWRDIRALESRPWHVLVLDEAQMVKNAGTRTARAVRRIAATHRLCLTGTPLENHLGELWAQFDFLLPGFLGDRRHFHQHWRRPIEQNGETARAALLALRVRPFILRRRKDQVELDLPPLTDTLVRLPLLGAQRDLYESVRLAVDKQVRRLLDKKTFAGAQIGILDALLKLRQVCCDPRLVKGQRPAGAVPMSGSTAAAPTAGPSPPVAATAATAAAPNAPAAQTAESAKLDWLRQTLPTLVAEGRRVLIFSQFTELLDLIAPELDALGLPWLALTGDTPPAARGALVARYQAGEVPLLLASLKAGGVGLNLTAADTVIHLDPWWNPAVAQQATARAHRIGQTRPVFVYHLVAEGSIEERLLALQARKQALADGVLGSDAGEALKFGEADLQGLLAALG